MSAASEILGGGGGIKQIQRGAVTPTAATHTVTLGTAVNPAKSIVLINGGFGDVLPHSSGYGAVGQASQPRVTAFSSTSISLDGLTVTSGGGTVNYVKFSWQVVEFY